jgi:nucleoside permease NupC
MLIGASVMSAPAALTLSKIVCPNGVRVAHPKAEGDGDIKKEQSDDSDSDSDETDKEDGDSSAYAMVVSDDEEAAKAVDSRKDIGSSFEFPESAEGNVVEAAANGASMAIGLVANIAAMLISFLSLVYALNMVLGKIGGMVNVPLSFEIICELVFMPIAWLLGTPPADCRKVARLIGTKIFLNEFVAYQNLSELLKEEPRGISKRAELIATYALCGFSNVGSIGVQLGGLTAICPEKRHVYAALVVSAMIAGNTCCFLTATVAGILQ